MPVDELQRLADEELMVLVAQRDSTAFEVLIERHANAAYSLSYRILGDAQDAEDVTQEALVSVWRMGARYDRAKGSVRTWVLGVTRNRAIDALRRDSVRPRRAGSFELDERELADEARPSTEAAAARHDESRRVRRVLNELPEEQRRAIGLAFYGGFSHSEIARMLNMPLGTVKARIRLGLEKVRAHLGDQA